MHTAESYKESYKEYAIEVFVRSPLYMGTGADTQSGRHWPPRRYFLGRLDVVGNGYWLRTA